MEEQISHGFGDNALALVGINLSPFNLFRPKNGGNSFLADLVTSMTSICFSEYLEKKKRWQGKGVTVVGTDPVFRCMNATNLKRDILKI